MKNLRLEMTRNSIMGEEDKTTTQVRYLHGVLVSDI